jgi:hypothetical protein
MKKRAPWLKDLRSSLEKLSAMAKDDAVADAEKAKRDERREEATQTHQEEKVEQAATAEPAAARAHKAVERTTRETTEKAAYTRARGAASVRDNARQATANCKERTQQVASDTHEAMTVYSRSSQKQAVGVSSTVPAGALLEICSVWMGWFGSVARINADVSQQMMQCRTVQEVAELQIEFAASALRNWMDGTAKVLEIAQNNSKQASIPLNRRLSEAADRAHLLPLRKRALR